MTRQESDKTYSRRKIIQMAGLTAAGFPFLPLIPHAKLEAQENPVIIFDKFMNPLVAEAVSRREKRAETDPESTKRIDSELNKDRVNFLLLGNGYTYEPPYKNAVRIGSQTIYSFDLKRRVIDTVSITHDTRAPEIERFLALKTGRKTGPIKIDRAFDTAGKGKEGFDLQRQVLESATGLSVDFQGVLDDSFIVDFINGAFGKIKVISPKAFKVNSIYFGNRFYPETEFNEGINELDGLRSLQFIKSVVDEVDKDYPDPQLEHNARKPLIIDGVLNGIRENAINPLFWKKVIDCIDKGVKNKQFECDFPVSLLLNSFTGMALNIAIPPFDNKDFSVPETGKKVYIVNWTQGDGGVRWAKSDYNPFIKEDFDSGFYQDPSFEVPVGGNPNAENLVEEYWSFVRNKVKSLIFT